MQSTKSNIVQALLLCLIFAVLLFSLVTSFGGEHQCTDDRCVLCLLQMYRSVLGQLTALVLVSVCGVLIAQTLRRVIALVRGMTVHCATLVYTKVKLSD